jgi:hypothetical protein
MSRRRLGEDWQEKVDPAFVRWYRVQRANAALGKVKDRKAARDGFNRNWKELCEASREFHQAVTRVSSKNGWPDADILKPLDGEVWPWPTRGDKPYFTNPEASSIFRTLIFLKYGVTFRELVTEIELNPSAYKKLLRVHEDYYRLLAGKRSLDTLKLKFNMTHFYIIEKGLLFGLKCLNQWELADCLNEICPCGSEQHSAEYLSKLRTQIQKALISLQQRNLQPTTMPNEGTDE